VSSSILDCVIRVVLRTLPLSISKIPHSIVILLKNQILYDIIDHILQLLGGASIWGLVMISCGNF
jgi:hypothetical protein